ncbi:MAG: alpha/beta fold hydrolase [Puniceicoccales bacterium]
MNEFIMNIEQDNALPGSCASYDWHGYRGYDFELNGYTLKIICPEYPRVDKAWVWKTEFLGAFTGADVALLGKGFHIVHLEIFNQYGSPKAVAAGKGVYEFVVRQLGFSEKACLLGMSRGGLLAYNWAAQNPDKVALIFGDNPVCDIKSWPGGFGVGPGSAEDWRKCLEAYELTDEEARSWDKNPIDHVPVLVQAGIPVLHVIGDADVTVPIAENSNVLRDAYKKHGGHYEEVIKLGGGHHPHGLPDDPEPIVDFFERMLEKEV